MLQCGCRFVLPCRRDLHLFFSQIRYQISDLQEHLEYIHGIDGAFDSMFYGPQNRTLKGRTQTKQTPSFAHTLYSFIHMLSKASYKRFVLIFLALVVFAIMFVVNIMHFRWYLGDDVVDRFRVEVQTAALVQTA